MKRRAETRLDAWLQSPYRKPLVIRGARQVGKSTLVRQFAAARGLTLHEVDLERHPGMDKIFATRDLPRILQELQFITGQGPIRGPGGLLFLDEIQAAPAAIPMLQDLYEDCPDLPVIAAGSLLEFVLADHRFSMPVGRIEYLFLEPMGMGEYLEAMGAEDLAGLLGSWLPSQPFPQSAHERLLAHQRDYLLVGGMPEAVLRFRDTGDLKEAFAAHTSILSTCRDDFAKYGTPAEVRRLQKVFDYVPRAIGEKFKYVRVDPAERSRELKTALRLLHAARIVRLAHHTDGVGLSLGATMDEKVFKPYFLDIGLVNTACGLTWIPLEQLQDRRFINEGPLAEQFVAQHLPLLTGSDHDVRPTYWLREGRANNAEVDFLIQLAGDVVALEVKAGKSGSLKSLLEFAHLRRSPRAVRLDLNPPDVQMVRHSSTRGGTAGEHAFQLLSLPLYLVEELPRVWGEVGEG